MKYAAFILTALLFITANTSPAYAQLNNKPFSFNTPDGGVGMSIGGQQAIINQEILNATPDNLVRNSSGVLLDVQEGPGNTAIVSNEGASGFLPKFKGTSYKGSNLDISVGVFNSFFSPKSSNGVTGRTIASIHTGGTISSWTARVTSGGSAVSYLPNNSIDTWTAIVQTF